jgi:quinol monooxygenase YgiN
MTTNDTCCTLVPYFKIHQGQVSAFRDGCDAFVEKTRSEPGCLFYGFSFDEDVAHCREGYEDAAALLNHLENVGALLDEALKISDLTRLEVHAPAAELDKLREPLASLNPGFFEVVIGFRR